MSGKPTTLRRRRRATQPPRQSIVPGDQDLAGTREAYQTLAAYMRILSWSLDQFFPEREKSLWETLQTLTLQRGLRVEWHLAPADAKPIGQAYRTGDRQRYRLLASRLSALAGHTGPDFLDQEREIWGDVWALGGVRGLVTTLTTSSQKSENHKNTN